eukprot:gb/GECG01011416.1/.p1 GENE.gb/GECG01011416.1/~~gb/GECG01011416.1/.p1  ORF type:complete len:737 (+),score=91.62 gb/GECG01011416.1/:1-2211(+)
MRYCRDFLNKMNSSCRSTQGAIDVPFLLSTCIRLTRGAGTIVRHVVHTGENLQAIDKALPAASSRGIENSTSGTGTGTEGGNGLLQDPQTIADRRAQEYIVRSLRETFGPQLPIVAEEGDVIEDTDAETLLFPKDLERELHELEQENEGELERNRQNMWKLVGQGVDWSQGVDPKRLCVFVDPLDGTKSFTRGQYHAVTTLLGITLDERPLAGVVGIPFLNWELQKTEAQSVDSTEDDEKSIKRRRLRTLGKSAFSHELYGLVGVGTFGVEELKQKLQDCSLANTAPAAIDEDKTKEIQTNSTADLSLTPSLLSSLKPTSYMVPKKAVISASRSNWDSLSALIMMNIFPKDVTFISGAGSKFVEMLLGNADVYLFPRPHTSRWDIAAGEALVRACGGVVSDAEGRRYRYEPLTYEACQERTANSDSADTFQTLNKNHRGVVAANCPMFHRWTVENLAVQHLARDPIGRVASPAWIRSLPKVTSLSTQVHCLVGISSCTYEGASMTATGIALYTEERATLTPRQCGEIILKRFLGERQQRLQRLKQEQRIHDMLRDAPPDSPLLRCLLSTTESDLKGIQSPKHAGSRSCVSFLDISHLNSPKILQRHSSEEAHLVVAALGALHKSSTHQRQERLECYNVDILHRDEIDSTDSVHTESLLYKNTTRLVSELKRIILSSRTEPETLRKRDVLRSWDALQIGNVGLGAIVIAESPEGKHGAYFYDTSLGGTDGGLLDLCR